MDDSPRMRIGVDLGGTKIEAIVMGPGSRIVHRERVPTPQTTYDATLDVIVGLVTRAEQAVGARAPLPVGCGTPGAISPATGRIKNANSTRLNGQPLTEDLERLLRRPVRVANDADCLALSEASDGAAAGAPCVFGVILGTGVGGGVVVNGRPLSGPNAIAGEWGHNALPWPRTEWDEVPGPLGWDGRHGSIEVYCCGPGLALDHERVTATKRTSQEVVAAAAAGDEPALATLARWEDRLARALASIINVLDPHVIVVGGGLSRVERLYANVPRLWDAWVFSDRVDTKLVPAMHGDSSGVRGAAWLWPEP
jgi:fructokinase